MWLSHCLQHSTVKSGLDSRKVPKVKCVCVCSFGSFSADLNSREQETFQPVHVINVDIQDNHEEATLGAFLICELCQCVSVTLL